LLSSLLFRFSSNGLLDEVVWKKDKPPLNLGGYIVAVLMAVGIIQSWRHSPRAAAVRLASFVLRRF
jgi:hypothetical protein